MDVGSLSYPIIPFDIVLDLDCYQIPPFTLEYSAASANTCLPDTFGLIEPNHHAVLFGKRNHFTATCEPPRKKLRMQSSHSPKPLERIASSASSSSGVRSRKTPPHNSATVEMLEEELHHLRDEWATIDIVLASLRNAFPVHLSASEEEIDRELSIAYDDLKAQVRHLERSIRRLNAQIASLQQQMDTGDSVKSS